MYLYTNIFFIVFCLFYAFVLEKYIKFTQRKFYLWVLLLAFCIILALRPESTPDTIAYIYSFQSIDVGDFIFANILQKYYIYGVGLEVGYVNLVKIFKLFSDDYRFFFFFTALTGIFTATWGLTELYKKIVPSNQYSGYTQIFALYVACYGLLYNGITLRAGIAMGLGIYSVGLLLNGGKKQPSILLFLGFLIHRSAILYLVIYLAIKYLPLIPQRVHILIWVLIGVLYIGDWNLVLMQSFNSFLFSMFSDIGISSSGYLLEIGGQMGLTDMFMWLIYGFFILFDLKQSYYRRYLNVIMIGAILILLMHGVRAISRAYDMFYMLSIPLMCALYYYKLDSIRLLVLQRTFLFFLVATRSFKMLLEVFRH